MILIEIDAKAAKIGKSKNSASRKTCGVFLMQCG
jgi:hypothetical protein